jgi:biopolymer transport protein ExbB
MLTEKLLSFTLVGAEWVLWLLLGLSVVSVAIMIERLIFFATSRVANFDELVGMLESGDLDGARKSVEGISGMEAEVVRQGVNGAPRGPDAVDEIMAAAMARKRIDYERRLAILGTLGNNAPFLGLFGTVLGIIRAFADLATAPRGGASTVMQGISEALVATAVGLFVALPAVVGFNSFQRWLRRVSNRAEALGHALGAHLRTKHAEPRAVASPTPPKIA